MLAACVFAVAAVAAPLKEEPKMPPVLDVCRAAYKEWDTRKSRDDAAAMRACLVAYDKEKKSPEAAHLLANLFEIRGDGESAMHWHARAADIPGSAFRMGAAAEAEERYAAAEAHYTKALSVKGAAEGIGRISLFLRKPLDGNVAAMLEKSSSPEASYILGRYSSAPEEAKKWFAKAGTFSDAKDWLAWYEGREPEHISPELLEIMFNKDTKPSAKLFEIAMRPGSEAVLRRIAADSRWSSVVGERRAEMLEKLSMYPECARELAMLLYGKDAEKARKLMHSAASGGDLKAVFVDALTRPVSSPPDAADMQRRAAVFNRVLFDPDTTPSMKEQSAKWLLGWFFGSYGEAPNVVMAEKMADILKLQGWDALNVSDAFLKLHDGRRNRAWLDKAEEQGGARLLEAIMDRRKALGDLDGWRRVAAAATAENSLRGMMVYSGILQADAEMLRRKALAAVEAAATGKPAEDPVKLREEADAKEKEAYNLIFQAADRDWPEALYRRAILAMDNKIVRAKEEILQDLTLSLAGGFAEAGIQLSKMAATGQVLPKDEAESARYMHQAALTGNPEAMRMFAVYLDKGYGMTSAKESREDAARRRKQADEWFAKAASRGDDIAVRACRDRNLDFTLPEPPMLGRAGG